METFEELANCEIHGEYMGKFYRIMTKKMGGICPKCQAEKDKKEKEAQERLAEFEEKTNKQRAQQKRIDCGISKRNLNKTYDDYICKNEGQQKAKSDFRRYFDNFPNENSMIMVGGVGTGKTLLASIGAESIIDKHTCELIKVIDVVRELKATWARDSEQTEEGLIKHYSNLDLLILDEVGSQFGSDTEKLFIFDIIDGRYQNMKPTILISNLDINGIKDAIGERCVDRLREGGGVMIAFDWESQRK